MTATKPLSYLSEQLAEWRKAGTYQHLRVLQSACEPVARFDGREVINLASNNYLGLADHPKLIEAQVEAAKKYRRGIGGCAHHLRNHEPASGAGAPHRRV